MSRYELFSSPTGRGKRTAYAVGGVGIVFVVAVVIGVAISVGSRSSGSSQSSAGTGSGASTSMKSIQSICEPTDYRETCVKSLSAAGGNSTDPKDLIRTGFQVAINQVKAAIENSTVVKDLAKDPRSKQALETCQHLLEYSIDDLQSSFERLGAFDVSNLDKYMADLHVWLSGAITFQESCLDGFENTTGAAAKKMKQILQGSRELTSNGLAMVTEISSLLGSLNIPDVSRRLLTEEQDGIPEFPSWVDEGRRKLLAAAPKDIKPDVVVAQDGSGKYKTIREALNEVPKKNNKTFVIYIKEGVYKEKVLVDKKTTNVMIIGDGPTKTVITGSLNYVDGVQTCNTATFTAIGSYFIAKDIKFENSAGAEKHQAVALRVQSDMSVIYNCHMDAFQDTLYAHAHRQFYRDCTISGTIDFIFGDALAVFQNCQMFVKKPLENQQCIVTASGRSERRSASAIVLQNCTISADPAYYPLRNINKAYLGRPWKDYSRTIIMQSQIDDLIQPQGWLAWMGNFALNTCFYAEYGNRGAGSATTGRAKWRGIKSMTAQHIVDFTPKAFFKGDDAWITATGVPYSPKLMAV
ncbi:probable pectinesterase/pectinesterase inhibitor 21 [Eucalyptus grandis]|uniref:probable pectinesterase/pectinesterase inhibitor 21 n=1 Tax=Eucalyptus grandis TaxID=71139 RepID=UPI00192EAB0F|nr:probable pectinesterase/pectinesterase inhibitor 21 [Eucalyptus grandis]